MQIHVPNVGDLMPIYWLQVQSQVLASSTKCGIQSIPVLQNHHVRRYTPFK